MHNYPLCIERNRMCCLTVIVSHRSTRGWNLQCQIRLPAGLSIHKFLMRSLSCWILKDSGVTDAVLVGEQESFNHQDVFLTVMIRLLVPSFQIKHCPNSVTVHIKERNSIYVSGAWWCECMCACVWWMIHSQVLLCAGQAQLYRKETLSGYRKLSPDTHFSLQLHCRCVFSLASEGKMAGKVLHGCNTESIPQNKLTLKLRESHKSKQNERRSVVACKTYFVFNYSLLLVSVHLIKTQ